jgi:hypothetical protein
VPAGVPVRVYCASGFRSYLALRILRQSGWDDVASLSGGLTTLRLERPDLTLTTSPAKGEGPPAIPRRCTYDASCPASTRSSW